MAQLTDDCFAFSCRLAGEDVASGAVVFPAGTVLEAQHIALAAALGLTEIAVRRRLKVAIFSTGHPFRPHDMRLLQVAAAA